jgi:UDP-N-acetylglucosamine acyltransferase
MSTAHVAHDCVVGNEITIASSAALAGHVTVGNKAFISGGVMVHQFGHVGRYAMIGGNSKITQDVLPFMITDGNPATVRGLNMVGLKRAGFSLADISTLKTAFQVLFKEGNLASNLAQLDALDHDLARELRDFVLAAERGFHRNK